MRLDDRLLGILLVLLGVAIAVAAAGMPTLAVYAYGPGFFPGLIGAGLVIFGVLLAVRGLLARDGTPLVAVAGWARRPRLLANAAAVLAATVGYILVVDTLGFLITGAVLLFLLVLLLWRRPAAAAVVAVLGTIATQQSFYELLLVPLPWGVLEPWSAVLTWQ